MILDFADKVAQELNQIGTGLSTLSGNTGQSWMANSRRQIQNRTAIGDSVGAATTDLHEAMEDFSQASYSGPSI